MVIDLSGISFSGTGGGSGEGMSLEQEYIISVALNDLNTRLLAAE